VINAEKILDNVNIGTKSGTVLDSIIGLAIYPKIR